MIKVAKLIEFSRRKGKEATGTSNELVSAYAIDISEIVAAISRGDEEFAWQVSLKRL